MYLFWLVDNQDAIYSDYIIEITSLSIVLLLWARGRARVRYSTITIVHNYLNGVISMVTEESRVFFSETVNPVILEKVLVLENIEEI